LFDHYDGILIEGVDRERWREEFYAQHGRLPVVGYTYSDMIEHPAQPANFNRSGREAERAVHVQMFDNEGTLHISQRAGMRVRGGWSRAAQRKSLELFAREEYGDRNNFRFAFFESERDAQGEIIDRYRRIRLRNGGSDREAGFIRDELSQVLFAQAGHTTTQSHVPAAIFLNGEYYGVAWLKSPRTENHLSRIFGGTSDNFHFVSGGDNRFEESWWQSDERFVRVDMREVSALAMEGFVGEGGDERFEEFSRRICVDELIRYYAMQIYLNNYDWPNHNMELWRYFPDDDELDDPLLHEFLRDGRWRVYSHDLEAGWAIWDDYDRMANEDTLQDILLGVNSNRWNSGNSSAFLYAFVNRPCTRAQLANTFVDLIEGAFSPENIISVLDDLVAQIENEHNYAMRVGAITDSVHWPTRESVANSRNAIRRFAQIRPDVILSSVNENLGFDLNDRFTVNLTISHGGGAIMNSRPIAQSQSAAANYFAGTTINISATPNIGFTFDYFIVNGTRVNESVVSISQNANVEIFFVEEE
jgi:hypothetical protein